MAGLIEQFENLNDVDLTRLNDRVDGLWQQIKDALAQKEKLANEQAAAQDAKAAASAILSAQSISVDDLIDALTTAQKRMK